MQTISVNEKTLQKSRCHHVCLSYEIQIKQGQAVAVYLAAKNIAVRFGENI
jgi:hypothetical protein